MYNPTCGEGRAFMGNFSPPLARGVAASDRRGVASFEVSLELGVVAGAGNLELGVAGAGNLELAAAATADLAAGVAKEILCRALGFLGVALQVGLASPLPGKSWTKSTLIAFIYFLH